MGDAPVKESIAMPSQVIIRLLEEPLVACGSFMNVGGVLIIAPELFGTEKGP
jgi:hypothetical protein